MINQKKYWLSYIRRYDSQKFIDKTFEEILEDVKTIKSDEQEGFVVNIDGHMIKVKGDDYVQIHRVLSKISSINLIIESVAENKIDDLISKVPAAYRERVFIVEKNCSGLCEKYGSRSTEVF